MTTTYGTIPTSGPPNLEYISRAKQRIKAGLGTRRPWKAMLNFRSLKIPGGGAAEALLRVAVNVSYFRMNYAMVALLILFLSLLWHPISLIVFLLLMAAWLFLYFLRDEPLVLLGHLVDDRLVLVAMAVLTVALLLLTDATVNILVAVAIAVVAVVAHAAFRRTEDLFLGEEEEAAAAALAATTGGFLRQHLRRLHRRPPLPPNTTARMAQPPFDPYYLYQQDDRSNINTLFVSGLPDDVKAREIHNLFRRRPGFDSCQLKYTGRANQVVAFATFFNHQSAMAALHALNGVKFDPQTGSVLHIELARSNSRRKRKPGSGAYVVIDKRTKGELDVHGSSSDDGDSDPDEPSDSDGNHGDLSIIASDETAIGSDNPIPVEQHEKGSAGGLCSTLFIANLGPNCTEDELKQAFSAYAGFNMVKMRSRGGMPVAFADFEEIDQAAKVVEELQGSLLPSSDRGGMHIEYARSKMRKH
ncbi:hypothetical protein VNO80_00292 [Phaseolus coccineus]|uniref:RRM domain-containing protein n=1 Tax=Phaseolus coccineus TaxID=3886 RepID=A0AAN9NZS5_PHACN